jgi:hypothetical protein
MDTLLCFFITLINSTFVFVITIQSTSIFVDTTFNRVTTIDSTWVFIIARNVIMMQLSSFWITPVFSTSIFIITIDVNELTTLLWVTFVESAWVVVVTFDGFSLNTFFGVTSNSGTFITSWDW